jgi:hypothetical protein
MDIGVWLRSPGLERYEAAFRDYEIDGSKFVAHPAGATDWSECVAAGLSSRFPAPANGVNIP